MSELKNFPVVYHKHHVGSKGWEQRTIKARDLEEAEGIAAKRCCNTSMPQVSYYFPMGDLVELEPKPRKLTLMERLTGRIKDQ